MARYRSRSARQKDKLRKRHERMQVVEAFNYNPVCDQWKRQKVNVLGISNIHQVATQAISTPNMPLTTPVTLRTIIGDGNCFFRSLSFVISGHEENHSIIRQHICRYMRLHPQNIQSFLPPSALNDILKYFQDTHMEEDKTWATEVEIFSAAMLLQTNIYLYTKRGVHWTWTKFSSQLTTTEQSIYLFHKNQNHFDVVVSIDNSKFSENMMKDKKYYSWETHQKYHSVKQRERKIKSKKDRYQLDSKLRGDYNIKFKEKYKSNPSFYQKTRRQAKVKYQTDLIFKKKKQNFTKLAQKYRYAYDPVYAKHKKNASKHRYATNINYRLKKKISTILKYCTNTTFRSSVKQCSKKKYAENEDHRRSVKHYSKKKYAENKDHRSSVKQYSKKKYAENALHRVRVQQYSRTKYQRFSSFRHNVKLSSIKKYGSSPLFRSSIKHQLKNQYHTNKAIRKKKKTTVLLTRKSIIKCIQKFKTDVADTPEFICTVCIRILYRNQVKPCKRDRYCINGELNKTAKECITGLYLHICDNCTEECLMKDLGRDKEWICHNCDRYLKADSMPPQSMQNNLFLKEIPEVLSKLNVLERQLIALRIPFMKLLSLPRGGQKGVKGPIVSVPTDLNTVTASLPRDFNDSQLIKVKLKRKLEYKGHYTYKWINPTNVLEALDNLLHNNCWYDDISLDKTWIENISESGLTEPSMEVDDSDSDEEAPQQTEAPTTIPVDSCFQPIDLGQEMLDTNNTLCLAPAEHQKPQNIFQEDGADAMAFPNLLPDGRNGLFENRKIKLSPAKYFNARLFSADTRFATDKEFIFFAQYVTEINYITSNISLALRKGNPTTSDGKKVTASMILDSNKDNEILKSDIGYRFLQPVRGTPPYWQRTMKDLYAIIRQLGIPTWFVTFSAAEMRWKEVTKTLLHLNNDTRPVEDIEWSERATLVTDNPVMCARMFDHRVKALFTDLIMSPSCPVGKVTDYFYRTEFQQRGSPHIHCLLWVQDSPKLNEDSDEEVCHFIDKYVSCRMPDEDADPELYEIISSVQLHSKNHSKSCKKYSSVCRFNFPRPPVQKTFIARADSAPEDQDMSKLSKPTVEELDEMSRQSGRSPKQILRDLWILLSTADDSNLTFREILTLADVTYSQFQQCLTDVATRNTVYLQRHLADIWVNNYNPHLSRAWNANLDIQFVTDAYACVAYILSYISKAETEMGDLLQNAKEEADEGNIEASAAMKKIANVYLQNREVSSQEAVYRVCGLHLKECTRDVVFIPAGKNIQRMSLPISVIKSRTSHGGDEDDIWMSSIYDKYYARPDISNFHKMSLAEFCSKYRILSKSQYPKSNKSPKLLPVYELQKGLGYIQQRKPGKEAVIRYPRFKIDRNPDDYYLTLIQLYLPHRTTFTLPPQMKDYEEFVRTGQMDEKMIHYIIDENRHHFEKDVTGLEQAWQDMQDGKIQEGAWAYIAPEAEVERLETIMEKVPEMEDQIETIPELNYNQNQNSKPKVHTLEYQSPKIPAKDIQDALRNMNTTQQQVFYKVRNWCLQFQDKQPEPFHMFLTGGAGTGKSHLVKCIYSEATRILSKVCTTPDSTTVLLTAPTGTAAFNIQGLTIHSAFAINKNIKLPYQPLGENILNTLRNKFEGLKILIVDEISMVDQKILCYVHGRLAQIKHSKNSFGGVSIIAVGDFYQLPPVRGLPLYKNKESFFSIYGILYSVK